MTFRPCISTNEVSKVHPCTVPSIITVVAHAITPQSPCKDAVILEWSFKSFSLHTELHCSGRNQTLTASKTVLEMLLASWRKQRHPTTMPQFGNMSCAMELLPATGVETKGLDQKPTWCKTASSLNAAKCDLTSNYTSSRPLNTFRDLRAAKESSQYVVHICFHGVRLKQTIT